MTVDPAFPLLAVLLLAVVFGTAAGAKFHDLAAFQAVVEQYRLLPDRLVPLFARALPVVELGAAVGLLWPTSRAASAAVLIVLLVVFAVAMAVNLARGRSDIDCGCFIGARKQRISWPLVLRNLALAGLGLTLLAEPTGRALMPLDGVTILTAAASLLLLHEALNRLFGLAPAASRGAA
jgi:hypothetical protein